MCGEGINPLATHMQAMELQSCNPNVFVRIRNAPLTRRVFFRIRFTLYEGSHLEKHP